MVEAEHVRTARRWAAGALTVATVVLGAYLALVVVGTWFVVSVVEAVADVGAGPFDLTPLLVDVAPGLLVGWGAGLVLAGVLGRGEAMGARTAGCVAGALGSLAGGAVLALTGVL